MMIAYFILLLMLVSTTLAIDHRLPFSRIKVVNDDIYFTLSTKSQDWHKLLSIDSIGADAIINFAKNTYGTSKCDFQIECYKYNIISNFEKIYSKISDSKFFPERIGLESEFDNKVQNGIDVECTNEKYLNNLKTLEENAKLSKVVEVRAFPNAPDGSLIFKGINKIKKTFNKLFENGVEEEKNKTINQNLRKEITEIKKGIEKIEKEEIKIGKGLLEDLKKINSNINNEKKLLENIWKGEIIAGMIGAIIVFCLFAIYYVCNGLLKAKHRKRTIN